MKIGLRAKEENPPIPLRVALLPGIVRDFISLYIQNVEGHIAQIAQCFAAGDLPRVAFQAHMIVSVAGSVGAMQTSAFARDVELATRESDQKQLAALVAALRVSGDQSSKALRIGWIIVWRQLRQSYRPKRLYPLAALACPASTATIASG